MGRGTVNKIFQWKYAEPYEWMYIPTQARSKSHCIT